MKGLRSVQKIMEAAPGDRSKPVFAVPYLSDAERIAQVWELRLKGYSHAAIAGELEDRFGGELLPKDWGAKAVFNDCQVALNSVQNEYRESAVEMVQMELSRFDKMQAAIWEKAEEGDVRAVEAVLSISRERRKMMGLDEPEKFALDWRVEIVRLLESGNVTPQQIEAEFGGDVLIAVNQLMLDDKGA